jgi:hypothetical protein
MAMSSTERSHKRRARIARANHLRNYGVALADLDSLEDVFRAMAMRPEDWAKLEAWRGEVVVPEPDDEGPPRQSSFHKP